jgi:penicillin G amidase
MKSVMKWAVRLLLVLVVAVVGFGGFMVWRFNSAVPAAEGTARIAGADGAISIVRDAHGVPHVFATTEADLYRGLGFAHAQDRFFQMDATRRAMQGRLAALIGESVLPMDVRARTMNWAGVAQAQWERLSPALKASLEAYTEGVNAALAIGPAPPEYVVFMAKPEPWQPVDSLAVALAMTDTLTGGEQFERGRARLARVLSAEQLNSFMGSYPDFAPTSYRGSDLEQSVQNRIMEQDRPGSNAWVVSGTRTASGRPILANDPHLPLAAPGPFYLSRLQGPDGVTIGASLPGSPMIVIGRTANLAWGTTTHAIDAADEIPLTADMAVTERRETIRVRHLLFFQREHSITVRSTADGPVLDPAWFKVAEAYGDTPIVLRTIADDPDNGVAEAVFAAGKATSVAAYFEALAPWTAPPQNLVVADTNGDIGLISPARYPDRDAEGVWRGNLSERIMAENPDAGFFATANNLQTPRDFPHPMPGGHDPYRVTRITEVLAADSAHTAQASVALQLDHQSILARRLAAGIARATPTTEAGRALQVRLVAWNGVADSDRVEPTLFAYFTRSLGAALYRDELGDDLYADYPGPRDLFLDSALNGAAPAAWCDDVTTAASVETCEATVGKAMDDAAVALNTERGTDEAGWKWGEVHAARFAHPLLSRLPFVGDRFVVTVPFGGNSSTVNVARNWHSSAAYNTVHAAGLRMVIDFADLESSRFVVTPGQSGNPLSAHYGDLAPLWARGEYFEIRSDWGAEAPPSGSSTWRLVPG